MSGFGRSNLVHELPIRLVPGVLTSLDSSTDTAGARRAYLETGSAGPVLVIVTAAYFTFHTVQLLIVGR